MRELKIRVWDGLFKEFKAFDNYFCKAKDGILSVCVNNDDITLDLPTGLKDKNGKEIYEGDIVEALIDGVWDMGENDIGFGKVKWKLEVVYNENRFEDVFKVIGSKSNPYRSYYLFDQALSELEVIGNIHENPELLKKEK